jgi:formylmethanofuran dehydrogenase subunit C
MEIELSGESCICDFTFDFYWQHKGSRLNPDQTIGSTTRRKMVEALKRGEAVKIQGDVGSRLGSSLGVDLIKLGGRGGPIESTGEIIVDGNAGSRMGISMLRGQIYVSGKVEPPLGNVIEVNTDRTGYKKYSSITEALHGGIKVIEPNRLDERALTLSDGILRETAGARCDFSRTLAIEGDAGMSTGILMSSGRIVVEGDCERNTGALMRGGRLVVRGRAGDFTAVEMRGGEIFIEGTAGSFACAKMKGGKVYARDGNPVSPAKVSALSQAELGSIARELEISPMYAMMYKKLSV